MTDEQKQEVLDLLNEAKLALADGDSDTAKEKIEEAEEIITPLPGTGTNGQPGL